MYIYILIFCFLCLVSDERGPISPYETDLLDYVAGLTKFNEFYSSSLMVEHFTFLDDFNNTWIISFFDLGINFAEML